MAELGGRAITGVDSPCEESSIVGGPEAGDCLDRPIATGLPGNTSTNSKLASLAGDVLIGLGLDETGLPLRLLKFDAVVSDEFSLREHAQFINEFEEDVCELQLRLQRLKLRILEQYLCGTGWTGDAPQSSEPEAMFGPKSYQVWQDLWAAIADQGPADKEQAGRLISAVNSLLPGGRKVAALELFGNHDLELCKNVLEQMYLKKERLGATSRSQLDNFFSRIAEVNRELLEMKSAPLLVNLEGDMGGFEETLRGVWSVYRGLLKEFAAFQESDSWVSPGFDESSTAQRGLLQVSAIAQSDYQRCVMPEADKLEVDLHRAIFRQTHLGENMRSILFNNGQSALNAILRLVERGFCGNPGAGAARDPLVFRTAETYWEVDEVIDGFCRSHGTELVVYDPGDSQKLINDFLKEAPNAVFVGALSSGYGLRAFPVLELLRAVSSEDFKTAAIQDPAIHRALESNFIYIVIDNTALGVAANWKSFDFSTLPDFVRVLAFESLLKYGEDGLDLVPAALVTAIGNGAAHDLKQVRARSGGMPPENTVRKLANFTAADTLQRKMLRHGRNLSVLAQAITTGSEDGGFISGVIHPELPWHLDYAVGFDEMAGGAGMLNVTFDFDFLAKSQEAQALIRGEKENGGRDRLARLVTDGYIKLVLQLAREMDLDINEGASFGFNVTRICGYERSLFEARRSTAPRLFSVEPYMRISVGTENIKEIKLIAAVIKRANQIFSEAIERDYAVKLAGALVMGDANARLNSCNS